MQTELPRLLERMMTESAERDASDFYLVPGEPPDVGSELGPLVVHERLGGLLKHYERKAA